MYGKTRPSTAQWAVEDALTGREVASLLDTLGARLPCMNPSCPNTCEYRAAVQGRQKVFCAPKCRVQYQRERQRLLTLSLQIEWTSTFDDPPCGAGQLDRLRSRVHWLLRAYGGEDPDNRVTVLRMTEPLELEVLPMFDAAVDKEFDAEEATGMFDRLAEFYAERLNLAPTWLQQDSRFVSARSRLGATTSR